MAHPNHFDLSWLSLVSAALCLALGVIHTWFCPWFAQRADASVHHSGFWHLLGETEVVLGFWAFVWLAIVAVWDGSGTTLNYLDGCRFTEPLFVGVIMVITSSRPLMLTVQAGVVTLSKYLPLPGVMGPCFLVLGGLPLLGSFITEPAAMTLSALLLKQMVLTCTSSERLRYSALAVLFVNISIGGTLTAFAAPPVVMVASAWSWNSALMWHHMGAYATVAVCLNAMALVIGFREELGRGHQTQTQTQTEITIKRRPSIDRPPWLLVVVHLLFLFAVVFNSEHAVVFLGVFLLFLALTQAYPQHHGVLLLREGLLIALFLGGLIVLGGAQSFWVQPLLTHLSAPALFGTSIGLTAFVDNAALTYLATQVKGLSDACQWALVAGAVTGGGLTLMANAPNPAGAALLRPLFDNHHIAWGRLFVYALGPTAVAAVCLAPWSMK